MKKTTLLAAAALLALASPAFAQVGVSAGADVKTNTKVETSTDQKPSGAYEEKRDVSTDKKDAAGTETSESSKAKVKIDANGNAEKSVETKSTVDPKGLMNQQTTKTLVKEEVKDGKHKIHRVKKVNGKTTLDTESSSEVDTGAQPAPQQ